MEQKPSVGRIVLFRSELANGVTEHAAMVTRVWSDTTVNLTVFLDGGAVIAPTSVTLDENMESTNKHAWRWPPRI